MSDQKPYMPDNWDLREAWKVERLHDDVTADDASAEFDRFIAKVKRDAAREALDRLADDLRAARDRPGTPFVRPLGFSLGYVENYRNTHHPEDVTP